MTAPARTVRLAGAEIARIGLGTNRLADSAANVAFVRDAVSAGIQLIDTAHTYTGGQSEVVIGNALQGQTGDCVVATKGGYSADSARPDNLRRQIDESLRRLRTDSIPLYYLHRADQGTPLEESLGVIKEYQDAGSIQHAGISAVTIAQIERARAVMPIAAVQNHYNLQEHRYDDVIDHCEREGIAFVAYFPLKTGHPHLEAIAESHGATASQIVLAWLLRRSSVVVPIPGTLSIAHARENLAALDVDLSEADFAALQSVA